MKKHLLPSGAFCLALFAGQVYAQNENPSGIKRCGTMEHLEWLKQQDPGLETRMAAIEEQIQQYIKNNPPKPHAVITIPTVVHVVWNTSAQNLADTYIQQQIDVLNDDFRKLNTDVSNVPASPFVQAADCEVEFCLATKDPTGSTTTGITRTQTSDPSFSTDNQVKYTSQGGKDIWDRNKYLNIWVCNLGGGLLGYAQFPGGSAATDGVVITYQSLPGPPTYNPYDLGRTATHEVGHWVNLYHIWGSGSCGSDNVTDTPTADGPHYSVSGSGPPSGCPTHPYHVNACGSGTSPNGENWQNYMDYTDDKCMFMFTAGQKTRMVSALNGTRSSLLTSAATNCTGVGVNEVTITSAGVSIFPNPSKGNIFVSFELPGITNASIIVYNVIGDAIMRKEVKTPMPKEIILDLNKNADGIYMVQVKTSLGIVTQKVILNK